VTIDHQEKAAIVDTGGPGLEVDCIGKEGKRPTPKELPLPGHDTLEDSSYDSCSESMH